MDNSQSADAHSHVLKTLSSMDESEYSIPLAPDAPGFKTADIKNITLEALVDATVGELVDKFVVRRNTLFDRTIDPKMATTIAEIHN